ncbi:metallophosphoesterase family protein [Tateyamaria pelophila]|uniref:metallophosphoesterase family protein n=1 Tax=Tateyamaria pelophila TaxID=328415 RepID=UPI001CBDD6B2|nr:metallophosphoesterase [Tateyamaria pelophila]
MHLSFAHLSDPHNPLTPNVKATQVLNKRLLGYLSWHRKRHLRHRPEVLTAMLEDIAAADLDHTIVAGDLTNIALPDEFAAARDWLKTVGPPQDVTVIPGNHDAYVRVPFAEGIGLWSPWMLGDDATDVTFPFVRKRGPVAFVMLSTSNPTPPLFASGTLGKAQLDRLEAVLDDLRGQDVFRVVVLHHPPEDYPTKRRKALRDRAAFRAVLARTGAELVLHGHQHHSHFGLISGPQGKIPVLGVPSASMALNSEKDDEARWNLINVRREDAGWRLSTHGRGLTPRGFETLGRWTLQVPLS